MKYIKLTSKPNQYYDEGTEVFNYEGKRFTLEEWYKEVSEMGFLLCRGMVKGIEDGDSSMLNEFTFEITEEYKELK